MAKQILAVTGGIASGKSTVTQTLKELGADVIDADAISRSLTGENGAALPAIRKVFGDAVFDRAGQLDRRALAARVFASQGEREALNAIIHPMVRGEMAARCNVSQQAVVVLDVPLLFETGMQDMADTVWVCFCSKETQIARVMERDGLTRDEAMARIASQWPTEKKLALADETIDTSGEMADTRQKILSLWEQLPMVRS